MKVPSFDLTLQNGKLHDELMDAIEEIVISGKFILGDTVIELEDTVAKLCGVKHGIGVANGSDALFLALLACDIGQGDEVITTPFTFFATAGAIIRAGAKPVFADIDLTTYNIDPNEIEKKITSRTKAILPVHLYGLPAQMERIREISKKYGLRIIEDVAQAIGSEYKGKPVGSLGDAACLSFFPTKNLGAFGDAGMIITDDDKVAEKARMLRVHGASKKYHHELLGINSRLDALQAKVLLVKVKYLDQWIAQRRNIAGIYSEKLSETKPVLSGQMVLPSEIAETKHVYHQYTLSTQRRDDLRTHLSEHGVASTVYYPVPLHMQKVFEDLGYTEGDFPNSETASKTVLSLPMFPELSIEQIEYVAQMISEFEWE